MLNMRTIAGRITRDLERKLPKDILAQYQEKIQLFKRVLQQKRHDNNKIYSLHEPDTSCIA